MPYCECCGQPLPLAGGDGVDWKRHEFIKGGRRIRVTQTQWTIFERLAEADGAVVTHEQLYDYLYGDRVDGGPGVKIVTVLICQLRKACPFPIQSVFGSGYILHDVVNRRSSGTLRVAPKFGPGITLSQLMAGRA